MDGYSERTWKQPKLKVAKNFSFERISSTGINIFKLKVNRLLEESYTVKRDEDWATSTEKDKAMSPIPKMKRIL